MSEGDRSIALTTACDDLQAQLEASDRSLQHLKYDLILLQDTLKTAIERADTLGGLRHHLNELRGNMREQRAALREVRQAASKLCESMTHACEEMVRLAREKETLAATHAALIAEHRRLQDLSPDQFSDTQELLTPPPADDYSRRDPTA